MLCILRTCKPVCGLVVKAWKVNSQGGPRALKLHFKGEIQSNLLEARKRFAFSTTESAVTTFQTT